MQQEKVKVKPMAAAKTFKPTKAGRKSGGNYKGRRNLQWTPATPGVNYSRTPQ